MKEKERRKPTFTFTKLGFFDIIYVQRGMICQNILDFQEVCLRFATL